MKSSTASNPNFEEAQQEFEQAREAAAEAYANFLAARDHLKAAALAAGIELKDTASRQFEEGLGKVNNQKDELYQSTQQYIRDNPLFSTGVAFLGGILISRLLSK